MNENLTKNSKPRNLARRFSYLGGMYNFVHLTVYLLCIFMTPPILIPKIFRHAFSLHTTYS